MNETKKILAPFASLKLTIVLLLLAMLLVLAGTTAQRDMDIQDVQHRFFHSWIAKVDLHDFQPMPAAKPGHAASEGYIGGWFYLPGGYSLIAAMLVNLLAAHTVRFKLRAKRIGIILIHAGLIMLLVGEIATSLFAVESVMRIDVGATANFSEDIRFPEFVVVDHSDAKQDRVTVIPPSQLIAAVGKEPIHNAELPFDVKVEGYYENSMPVGPMQSDAKALRLATAGSAKGMGIVPTPKVSGAGGEASMTNNPSAFLTFSKNGKNLGTYLVSMLFDRSLMDLPIGQSQKVEVDGKTYTIDLRFRRYYKPYTVHLEKFTHEIIPGTDIPRDYASTIQLVSPENHVDREVRIWMNHPLRFNGETFYQQSFANNDKTTVLQVVRNPAWTWPYIACAVGALGLVTHFGITLITFLRRRFAPTEGSVGAMRGREESSARNMPPRKKGVPPKLPSAVSDRYTLVPEAAWKTLGIPLLAVAVGVICVSAQFFNSAPSKPYDLEAFGHVPIFIEGRVQPLDSVARNFLGIVSGGHTEFKDDRKKIHPAIEWLADVMTRSHNWNTDKVIRIDHPQIKDLLGLKEEEKLFSWNDVGLDRQDVREKLDRQSSLAADVGEKERDAFQNGILELHQHLGIYLRLLQVDALNNQLEMMEHPEKAQAASDGIRKAILEANPKLVEDIRANRVADPDRELSRALAKLDRSKLTQEERDNLDKPALLEGFLRRAPDGKLAFPEGQLFLIPPAKADEPWSPILSVVDDPEHMPSSASAFLKIAKDYAEGRAQDFNADLAGYEARAASMPDTATVNYEVGFNQFNPFYQCMVMYVCIFLLAFVSWLVWAKPLWRTGMALTVLALIVHSIGIVSRIYISGRPPVTNLYSASVYIGWCIVLFSLGLEVIFRNGIGLVAGSTAGFLSLLVAAGFASGEGDTMRQLQAVLDTNGWLATHVVCVTMGYMASVLAGVLAIIYLLSDAIVAGFRFVVRIISQLFGLGEYQGFEVPADVLKEVSRMIYGIVCFAILFSFVGTILGGIWADQSWGRFWGWDPKENGAVLVVLWNALILHARWSGVVRDRGVAVLAILGNIVVGWSFVGTNLMGVGLHSYGFMSGAQAALLAWVAVNVAIAASGLIPRKFWAINRASAG